MDKLTTKNPDWDNDIIAVAGYWEPVSFRVRAGLGHKNIFEDEATYSRGMADKLSRIGINLVIWPYYKGLGIEVETEEMCRTAGFFKLLDEYGIGKGVYINLGSIFADTFLAEHPEAEQWLAIDQFGMPHQYSEFYRCYYRFRPCMSHPEFAEYVSRAAIKAVDEAGADLIAFDNSAQLPCYCENCRQGFPEHVLSKYPLEKNGKSVTFEERFGYEFRGRLELPRGTSRMPIDTLPGAHEPVLYEWVRYRQHLYEETHRHTSEAIRTASRSALISWNIALDHGEFPGLVWGIDPETACRCESDFFFSEDANHAGIEDGRLISHISTYKYGRAMKNRVFVHNTPPGGNGAAYLNYAEAAVFNQGCLGRVMWATDNEEDRAVLRNALAFFRRNRDVFIGSRPVSRTALYRCSESETAYFADSMLSRHAVEQVLIKNSIQYDHLINDTFDHLTRYELLICPNTACVSDHIVAAIADFIRNGGRLLCTEQSLSRDEYGMSRISKSDMGLFGERDERLGRASRGTEKPLVLRYLQLDESFAERIFVVPVIEYAVPFSWDPRISVVPVIGKDYFAEPLNKQEILDCVSEALNNEADVSLKAPENVIVGVFDLAGGGRVVHVLDYQSGRLLADVQVRFKLPVGVTTNQAVFSTIESTHSLALSYRDGYAECTLPEFETYGFIRI